MTAAGKLHTFSGYLFFSFMYSFKNIHRASTTFLAMGQIQERVTHGPCPQREREGSGGERDRNNKRKMHIIMTVYHAPDTCCSRTLIHLLTSSYLCANTFLKKKARSFMPHPWLCVWARVYLMYTREEEEGAGARWMLATSSSPSALPALHLQFRLWQKL